MWISQELNNKITHTYTQRPPYFTTTNACVKRQIYSSFLLVGTRATKTRYHTHLLHTNLIDTYTQRDNTCDREKTIIHNMCEREREREWEREWKRYMRMHLHWIAIATIQADIQRRESNKRELSAKLWRKWEAEQRIEPLVTWSRRRAKGRLRSIGARALSSSLAHLISLSISSFSFLSSLLRVFCQTQFNFFSIS